MAGLSELVQGLRRLRSEAGQVSWVARRYLVRPVRLRHQWRAIRGLSLQPLPRSPRRPGEVWAVTMVRDELDVLPQVVTHLFGQGIDHVLVADNQSTDGTREMLEEWARREPRLHVGRDEEPAYWQSEKVSWLAHLAWRAGADWVVPFDADEFWFAHGETVADALRRQSVGIVHATFHHMVPTEVVEEIGADTTFALDAAAAFPGKVAARSHPLLEVHVGNHAASRVGGETVALAIAHAQYRNPQQLVRKMRQGHAATALAGRTALALSPHWAAGDRLLESEAADVWANISRGRPDGRIQYRAEGPMVEVTPLAWATWDPHGEIAAAQGGGND